MKTTYVHCYEINCFWNSGDDTSKKDFFRCKNGNITIGDPNRYKAGWENHICSDYKFDEKGI
jgi:hypothetical protein